MGEETFAAVAMEEKAMEKENLAEIVNEKKRGRDCEVAQKEEKTFKSAKTDAAVVEEFEKIPYAKGEEFDKTRDGSEPEKEVTSIVIEESEKTLNCAGAENGDLGVAAEAPVVAEETQTGEDESSQTKRLKKRKIAMIVAYNGVAYQGMQRNPGAITIEGELEQALYRAGAITKENFGCPRKVDWMRAARTDKGVSAIGQVVSGSFIIEPEGFVERVNSFLPRDIALLGYKRVTASFNSKKLCDRRRYEYIIPVHAFDPSKHLGRETANSIVEDENEKSADDSEAAVKKEEDKPVVEHTAEVEKSADDSEAAVKKQEDKPVAELEKGSEYRLDEAEMNRFNRILARYQGTHNYHNFTARVPAEDPSAHRYIISFEAEDIFSVNGVEFVRCHVIGQSFMLHQIRKMIGLAVAIMRGAVPETIIDIALRKDTKFNVPMAPELGLFLEECYYSAYNNRFKGTHEELSLKDFTESVNEFKKNVIYPHIASTDARENIFGLWLHSINDRHFPDFVAAREGTYKPGNRTVAPA